MNEFKVIDDKSADWAIEKIHETREEYDRRINLAKERINDLKQEINKLEEQKENETSHLTMLLKDYFQTIKDTIKPTKAGNLIYKLLEGRKISLNKKVNYIKDEEKLLDWAEKNNFIKITKSCNWADIKSNIETIEGNVVINGEVVDFITLEEIEEFKV